MSPRLHTRPSSGRKHTLPDKKRAKYSGFRGGGPSGRARLAYSKKAQPRKLSVASSEDSDENPSEMNGDAGMDDDSDEAEDESDVSAPSYSSRQNRKAGLQSTKNKIKDIKEPLMFDSDEEQEAWFRDSEDDDEIYDAVDEISDDDEDVNAHIQEEFLAAQFFDHPNVAANFLGDIDGFSVFGFENDVDRNSFSSSSESSDDAVVERRVHFESDIEKTHSSQTNREEPELLTLPSSNTIPIPPFTREELQQSCRNEEISAAHRAFLGDPDEDSDLTDEELPAEAHTTNFSVLEQKPLSLDVADSTKPTSSNKRDKKPSPRRRGPPLGIFEFDGDKPWAVLDPSGTKVHIAPPPDTNRHDWLERKAQHALNQVLGIGSAESSPRGSLATLLDDSDRSVTSSQENTETLIYGAGANLMMAGLNGDNGAANRHGHAIGPPEAFYAPAGSHIFGDYLIDAEDFDMDDEDRLDPTGEGRLKLEDFIVCGGDSEDDDDMPMSPTGPSADIPVSTPTHKKADSWSHLNSDNVLSFRRNADPSSASRNQPWNFDLPPKTPGPSFSSSPISRKRKARSPPYQGEHYKDVTVVARKLITPKTKRRRANTTH